MVAGGYPMNVGNALAEGAWIAPLDDDDEFTEDHVERLVAEARLRQLEMIYSKARYERTPGTWIEIGGEPLRRGNISHGTVLYSSGLRFLRYSSTCWKRGEPADWNMWRRMRAIGVRIGFLNAVTFTQYLGAQERAAVAAVPPVA
jgi:glycosyltransferase involved in cell wall biosynthesis